MTKIQCVLETLTGQTQKPHSHSEHNAVRLWHGAAPAGRSATSWQL